MIKTNQTYDLSIIIPFYKRDVFVLDILNELDKENTYLDLNIEIIFIDSNSSINLDKIIKSYMPTSELSIKKIDTFNSASYKRNLGIKKARSNNIISLDDDCIPGENFINVHYKSLKKNDANVICSGVVRFSETLYQNSNYYKYRNERHRIYDNVYHQKSDMSFYNIVTMNMSFKKNELIDKNLLFDEDYTFYGLEDNQFGLDGIKKGFKLKTCLAPIIHREDTSIDKFLVKIQNFTENFLKFYKKNIDSFLKNESLKVSNQNIDGITYLHSLVKLYFFIFEKHRYLLYVLKLVTFFLTPFYLALKLFLKKTDSKEIFYFFFLYKFLTIVTILKTLFGRIR